MAKAVRSEEESPKEKGDEPAAKVDTLRNAVAYLELLRRPGSRKTDAAEQVQGSLSGMAHTIKRLQIQLGVTLVERDPRAVEKVTDAGKKFIVDAKKVITAYDRLFNSTVYGLQKVKVGAYPSVISLFFGRRVFPRLFNPPSPQRGQPQLPTFPSEFPFHQLEVTHAGGRAKIMQQVEQQALDFGVIDRDATQSDRELAKGFRWIPLFESAPFGALYPSGMLPEGTDGKPSSPVPLEFLQQRTLFLNEYDFPAVQKSGLGAPATGKAARCCVSSYGEVYEAVAAGAGIGLGFMPRNAPSPGPVKFLPLSDLASKNEPERGVLRRLKDRGKSRFGVYVRNHWKSDKSGLPPAAVFVLQAVLAVRHDYLHDYVT